MTGRVYPRERTSGAIKICDSDHRHNVVGSRVWDRPKGLGKEHDRDTVDKIGNGIGEDVSVPK